MRRLHKVRLSESVMRIVKDASIYHKTTKRVVVCRLSEELWCIEGRMSSSPTHKVIGQMWIISRRLISWSRPRTDHSSSVSHFLRTILSVTAAAPSKIALIHQLISGGADGSPIDRLIKLWSELLLGCSAGSHLHPTIHIDYYFTVVLAVVLPTTTHTVITGGCRHCLHELLLLMALRSL
jgi:hypothetical protein